MQRIGFFVAATALLFSSELGAQETLEAPSLMVTPQSAVAAAGPQGGPFSPHVFEYRLSASAGTVQFSVRAPSWLSVSASSGTVGTDGVMVKLPVNETAAGLPPRGY